MSTGQHTRIHENFLNLFPRSPERNVPTGGLLSPNAGPFVTLYLFLEADGQERNFEKDERCQAT